MRDELLYFQNSIYCVLRFHQVEWAQERVKYAELQVDNLGGWWMQWRVCRWVIRGRGVWQGVGGLRGRLGEWRRGVRLLRLV
jgi:hypothetical protein